MAGKVAVVTGASSGIGLETARALAERGTEVVMLARDATRGEASRAEVERSATGVGATLLLCDFANFSNVRDVGQELRACWPKIDVLCNNAGAILPERTITADGCELTMQTNHFSHFLLTRLLEPSLKAAASARVITVSSDAHLAAYRGIPFEDLTFEKGWAPFRAYAVSKLANIMFAYELARRLDGTRVTSNAMHPGVTRTGFGRHGWGSQGLLYDFLGRFYLTAAQGADTAVFLASAPEVEGMTGRYYYRRRPKRSGRPSYDTESQRRLWEVSERVVSGYL